MKNTFFKEFCTLEIMLPFFLLIIGAFISPYEHNFYDSYKKFLNNPIWYILVIGFCAYIFPRIGFLQHKITPTKLQNQLLYVMTIFTAILAFYILK